MYSMCVHHYSMASDGRKHDFSGYLHHGSDLGGAQPCVADLNNLLDSLGGAGIWSGQARVSCSV